MASDCAMLLDDNSSATTMTPNSRQQGAIMNGIGASKDGFHDMSDEDDLPLVCFISSDIIPRS